MLIELLYDDHLVLMIEAIMGLSCKSRKQSVFSASI